MHNCEVFYRINEALQQKFAGHTFQKKLCNVTIKLTGQSNSTKFIFQLNPSRAINWIDSEEEFLRMAKGCHNHSDGLFE